MAGGLRNERKLSGNWAVGTVLEGVSNAIFLRASFVNSDVLVLTALQRTEKTEGIFTATKHLADVLKRLSLSLHYDSRLEEALLSARASVYFLFAMAGTQTIQKIEQLLVELSTTSPSACQLLVTVKRHWKLGARVSTCNILL